MVGTYFLVQYQPDGYAYISHSSQDEQAVIKRAEKQVEFYDELPGNTVAKVEVVHCRLDHLPNAVFYWQKM